MIFCCLHWLIQLELPEMGNDIKYITYCTSPQESSAVFCKNLLICLTDSTFLKKALLMWHFGAEALQAEHVHSCSRSYFCL